MFCPPLNREEADSSCSFPAICLHSVFVTILLKTICKTYGYCLHIVLPYQYLNFFPFQLPPFLANTDISSRFEHMGAIIQATALQT